MSWEQRGANLYYYRKEWQNGRCVSTYIGSGETAELIAQVDMAQQHVARAEREEAIQQRYEQEILRLTMKKSTLALQSLTSAVLQVNGYHQHKGQWRKSMQQETSNSGIVTARQTVSDHATEWKQALNDAIGLKLQATGENGEITPLDRANHERMRRAAIRRVFRDYPDIWTDARTTFTKVEHELMKAAGYSKNTNGLIIEQVLESMRTELGYQEAPLLEQLLIEHVVLAWLDFDTVQRQYAMMNSDNHTQAVGIYRDRRMNSAQQRYLRAIEALARVRRLAQGTPLQVNIGGQQINVAGKFNT